MAIDSSQYNFMLSAADTMADNYRMQEEAERQERERVYKRKMLEEAMAQKKKAEEEAQLQYKRKKQGDDFMNFAVTGNVPSVQSVASYTNSGTSAKKKTAVPSHTTGTTYAPPAYIPTPGGEASAALYRFNANAATDEDKKRLNVSGRLPQSHHQKQVVNTVLSEKGKQLLRDYGYDVENMTGEEQIEAVNAVNEILAEANVLSRKQAAVNVRNAPVSLGNAMQEMLYEKDKAKSSDDVLKKLDARIAESQANVDAELEALTPELNRLTNMGYIEEKKKRIKAVRDKYGLDDLLKQREKISAELKMFNAMYGDEYRKEFFEDNQEGRDKFDKERDEAWAKRIKPLIDDYNQKLVAEKYPGVPLLPDVTEENVTPEEVREEYKRLPDGDYFTTTQETVPLDENDKRYERYKKIKDAEAKGEFNKVYDLLSEDERKRFFPNYDPKKQREFNYRYELKKKAQAEKDALPNDENYQKLSDVQIAIIKAKQGIPLTTDESNALQKELGHDDATVAYDEAKAYDEETLQKFGISRAQNKVFGKQLLEEYGKKTDAEYKKFQMVNAENRKKITEGASDVLKANSPSPDYIPSFSDIKLYTNLVMKGLSPAQAAKFLFQQKIIEGTITPDENFINPADTGMLTKIYGYTHFTSFKNENKARIARAATAALGKIPRETQILFTKKPADLSDDDLQKQWEALEPINDNFKLEVTENGKKYNIPSPVAQLYRANGIERFRRQIIGDGKKVDKNTPIDKLFITKYPNYLNEEDQKTLEAIKAALGGEKPDENAPQIVKDAHLQHLINFWLKQFREYEQSKKRR